MYRAAAPRRVIGNSANFLFRNTENRKVAAMPLGKTTSQRSIAALARKHGEKAIKKLVALMDDPDPRIASDCAKAVLDRAIGRPIAMTADVTDRLDEFTDEQLDAAIDDIQRRIGAVAATEGEEGSASRPH